MSNYICDDRLNRELLAKKIKNMTDEEFKEFQAQVEKTDILKNFIISKSTLKGCFFSARKEVKLWH